MVILLGHKIFLSQLQMEDYIVVILPTMSLVWEHVASLPPHQIASALYRT